MARFWGVCVLMLSTFLLFESQAASIPAEEESSSSAIDFDTGYLIVAPKIFVAGSVETICISLQNMTGPLEVAIRLMDNYTAMAKLPIQFMEFKMACYDIEVPSIEYEMMHATLLVKMRRTLVTQSGFEVVEKRMVTINGVNTEMFIETDKPVYKPGQTVKFRILNINQDLKPDVTPVSKIWIESPSGVKMQQWRNQESTDGLIDLELPMTNDPVTGTWSIIAIHKDRKSTRTFEVDEYVLPKFEVVITPPTYVMINTTSIRVKVCGRYTYGQPVRGSFEARITVKSTGWNFRERKTITRRVDDTGPSGCNEFPVDLSRLELNSTDFSLWDARLSVHVEYTETSTGVMLEASSESSQITRDALKLQFDSPNIFKPGVPYYGKIFVTHPDGSPAAGKLISLSCNTDQGQIFDKNLTSPENGAIEFTVTDINITATSLNLYAHAPGFNIPPRETYGRQHTYTLHDPATSHYARPQFSPSGSFLQIAPIRGVAAVGSEQTLRIDFTANDPEENPRFRFVVMSRGNIIATRFYRAHKRPKRQAEGSVGSSGGSGPSQSEPDGSVDSMPSMDGSMDGIPSVDGGPSDMGSLDIPSFIPSVLGGSSFSSDFSFVPPTDAPVIIVEPGEVYSRELFFRVTPDMVPETRILAYYIGTDGEVVADSIAFRVQKKFENEVDIAFSDEEMMPGAETQLMIHASPGSLCAVGVVDRSVHILGGDNQLKADKIFASLDKYQLTSSGGYIDASTHCVPEEDEYPQFFPLGRKKRGIFLPGYGSKYQDSSRAFKDMGLLFMTNMDVETSPCVGVGSVSRGTAEVENAAEGPIAVPLHNKENAIFDDGGVLEKPDVPNDVLETAPRIRSYFPETWLWDLRRTDSVTGETSITMEVPDTVTEWIGSGFCTSVEYGVGVSPPTKLRAFQPFFLSYTLPYSVVRGEVVPVTVTVFNYLTESLVVEVSLELTEGFRMARKSRPRKKVCVGGSQSQSVEFRIQPRKLGNIALQALGLSVNDQDALCGNELVSSSVGARDGIYKELLVEAEGTEVETTQNCYFCPEEAAQSQKNALFQRVQANWQHLNPAPPDANIEVTMTLIHDTGSDTIRGNNLWKMGVYATDSQRAENPTKYGYVQNILDETAMQTPSYHGTNLVLSGRVQFDTDLMCNEYNPHPYFCVEMGKNEASSTDFTIPISGGLLKVCNRFNCKAVPRDTAKYSRMGAQIDMPSSGNRIGASLTITPASDTTRIVGDGLWKVSAFASRNAQGTGTRNGEVRNILDRQSLRAPMEAGRVMTLNGEFDFPRRADLGCRVDYQYLCFEFAKGDRPSMTFEMQSNIMCREQTCSADESSNTGNSGNTGKNARYTNVGAQLSRRNTRFSATLSVTPSENTDIISGEGLWRVGAFGSASSRGEGRRRGEVPDILDYLGKRKTLQPPSRRDDNIMELSGSFTFPEADQLGCNNAYRYLCLEFAKGDRPSTEFSMSPIVLCEQQECAGGSTGGTGGSGTSGGSSGTNSGTNSGNNRGTGSGSSVESNRDKTVDITGLAWAPTLSRGGFFDTVEATVNLDVSPGSTFDGTNLWRMGAFVSDNTQGTGRNDETSQILDMQDRSRSIVSGRPNTFQIRNPGVNISDAGCEGKRYLCLEFGKSSRPNPPFTIRDSRSHGESRVSCKVQQCKITPKILVNSVRPSNSDGIEIREGEENDVNFDVLVKYNRGASMSIRGRGLWKVQAWGSATDGDTEAKISPSDQVLGDFESDTAVDVSSERSEFKFQRLSHTIDMRPDVKCKKMKFLCARLQKDRPQPDFKLLARNNDINNLMGCVKVRCIALAKPTFTVSTIGVVRTPFSAVRSGRSNEMTLDINVVYDRATTTDITGNPGWALEAWGSPKKNGKKAKVSPANLRLGSAARQNFEVGGVLRFNSIPYNFDLNSEGCGGTKFLCIKLTKTGPGFTLKAKPNSKVLTKCSPLSCLPGAGESTSSGSAAGDGGAAAGGGASGGSGASGGGGRQSSGPPQVTLLDMNVNFEPYAVSDGEVPVTANMDLTSSPESGIPTGPNLWHFAVYGNSRSDGSDWNKLGYTGNVLTPKQAKTRLVPGGTMSINGIRFNFNMGAVGCHPYNYLCLEYGKGTSESYEMVYPQSGKRVSCQLQQCSSMK